MYGSVPAAIRATTKAHESGVGKVRKTLITFDALEVTMVDEAGTIAFGSKKIYDFLEGVVEVLSSRGKLTRVERTFGTVSTGIFDAFDGDWGAGTVAADNGATLATTEQNLVPTTATAQAASGVSAGSAAVATTRAGTLDGSGTAIDVFLNILVDDADHDITTDPSNLLVTGEVEIEWVDAGDNA